MNKKYYLWFPGFLCLMLPRPGVLSANTWTSSQVYGNHSGWVTRGDCGSSIVYSDGLGIGGPNGPGYASYTFTGLPAHVIYNSIEIRYFGVDYWGSTNDQLLVWTSVNNGQRVAYLNAGQPSSYWFVTLASNLSQYTASTGTLTVEIDASGGASSSSYNLEWVQISIDYSPTCVTVYPNPYKLSPGKTLTFSGRGVPDCEIKIYTINGRLVKTIKETRGLNEVEWNGTNEDGQKVERGVYLYAVKNPWESNNGKIAVLK